MKYLKTVENDYVKIDIIKIFSVRNKKLYAFTDEQLLIIKEFDTNDAAQAYLDTLIWKMEHDK